MNNMITQRTAECLGINREDYTRLVMAIRQDVMAGLLGVPKSERPWTIARDQLDKIIEKLFGDGRDFYQARMTLYSVFRHRFKLKRITGMLELQIEEMFSLLPELLEMMGFDRQKAEQIINKVRKDGANE